MKRFLGTFAHVLALLLITNLARPAVSRADDCAPGWVWSPGLSADNGLAAAPRINDPVSVAETIYYGSVLST